VESKRFLKDLNYLLFSEVDAFFSKNKISFMEDIRSITLFFLYLKRSKRNNFIIYVSLSFLDSSNITFLGDVLHFLLSFLCSDFRFRIHFFIIS